MEGIVEKMKEGRFRRYGHVQQVIGKNKEEMVRDMEWRD